MKIQDVEMPYRDPIVAELRAFREAYAARFHYDVRAIIHDLQAKTRAAGGQTVTHPPRPAQPRPVAERVR